MTVSTGVPGLDDMLGGGIPAKRMVLFTGGPGTGKSTLGMQFLQAGLADGDECLFISTEQTPAELKDSFARYDFDLSHDRLTITNVHAIPGKTLETDEEILKLDGSDVYRSDDGLFARPFTSQYIAEYLEQFGPCDRVVLDSVSGLAAMTDADSVARQLVVALIRLFTDHFDATSLVIGEERERTGSAGTSNALRYNAHGIVEFWQEPIDGNVHRFIRVPKMRGINHDTRIMKLQFRSDGVRLAPRRRTRSEYFMRINHRRTGLSGLDQLTGGGLIGGSTALLEHDGRAEFESLVIAAIAEAVRTDDTIVLFPSANMDPERFDAMLPRDVGSVDELIADDRLFVLDFVGSWSGVGRNAFDLTQSTGVTGILSQRFRSLYYNQIKQATKHINQARRSQPAFAVMHTESLLQHLSPIEVRQMYYWAKRTLLHPDDRVLFVQNPAVMDETLAEFYAYDAEQILSTWVHDGGLQFVKLEKSPSGHLGDTRLVTHIDAAPYIAIEQLEGPNAGELEKEGASHEPPRRSARTD